MNCTMIAALGSLLAGGTLAFGMLFHTGFEDHDYTVDQPLAGQDGWVGLASANAAMVVGGHQNASSGRRAVSCWGGDLDDFPSSFLYDGAWEQEVPFDPSTRPSEVRVQADVRLDGPDTGTGPGDDLVSANLMARNSVGLNLSPFMYLSSNGNVYAGSGSDQGNAYYQFETPIRFGRYNELAMTLNYLTHICTFEVNGRVIGSLPFGGANEQWHGVLLEMAAYDDPNYVDPTDYTGYWDNISVTSRPAGRCHH